MDGASQASLEIVTRNYAPFNAAVAKYVEKLEQPDPRIASQAFREEARGVGHVFKALGIAPLLTLIGGSLVVLCQQWSATAPARDNASLSPTGPISLPDPPSIKPGEKVVTNYTLFTTVDVAGGIDVVTGWDFAKSTDNKPERQFCYLRTPEKFGYQPRSPVRVRGTDLAGDSKRLQRLHTRDRWEKKSTTRPHC